MKANELMIGDWVILKSNEKVPDTRVRIEEISKRGVFVTDCDNLIGFDELKAIPLTTKILEKNGFEVSPKDKITGYINVHKHPFHMGFWPDENYAEWCYCNTSYVHQLQQALRLCGLTELAENFKIK